MARLESQHIDNRMTGEWFRRLIEHAPDAILVLTNERLRYVNAAAVQWMATQNRDDLILRHSPTSKGRLGYRDAVSQRGAAGDRPGLRRFRSAAAARGRRDADRRGGVGVDDVGWRARLPDRPSATCSACVANRRFEAVMGRSMKASWSCGSTAESRSSTGGDADLRPWRRSGDRCFINQSASGRLRATRHPSGPAIYYGGAAGVVECCVRVRGSTCPPASGSGCAPARGYWIPTTPPPMCWCRSSTSPRNARISIALSTKPITTH